MSETKLTNQSLSNTKSLRHKSVSVTQISPILNKKSTPKIKLINNSNSNKDINKKKNSYSKAQLKVNASIDTNLNLLLKNMKFTCGGPCIGIYEPKYSSILKKTPSTYFIYDQSKKKNKKYLLQKLCKSYSISTEYKIVNI